MLGRAGCLGEGALHNRNVWNQASAWCWVGLSVTTSAPSAPVATHSTHSLEWEGLWTPGNKQGSEQELGSLGFNRDIACLLGIANGWKMQWSWENLKLSPR